MGGGNLFRDLNEKQCIDSTNKMVIETKNILIRPNIGAYKMKGYNADKNYMPNWRATTERYMQEYNDGKNYFIFLQINS